ncbi:hypothetical protein [Halosimplex halobium]|uniref:hypothetical protein n=1 Tax=Halosimplex halobium TaxID=3396618 RepID=UPI003F56FCAA
MQVVCKDGTAIQCTDFEAIDSGVLLYQDSPGRETRGEGEEEAEEERRAAGFVPITELRFVVPDEMLQASGRGQRAPAPEPRRGGAPPGAPTGQGGGMAQQQQVQGFPGGQSSDPYGPGNQ